MKFLVPWRDFIRVTKQSNPFNEIWAKICTEKYGKAVALQKDTITRWSSTISMLTKAVAVKEAVLDMIGKAPEDQKVSINLAIN